MSRRRIKQARSASKSVTGKAHFMCTFVPVRHAESGKIKLHQVTWAVSTKEMRYMPIYERAHQLMPLPRSPFLTPDAYGDELPLALEVVEKTAAGERTNTEDVLRALAILGHTPRAESIRALSGFSESDHSLAPVAGLALSECTSLFSVFDKRERRLDKQPQPALRFDA